MTTIYPGTLTYQVAEFLLSNRLPSSRKRAWCVNILPLVERHGYKPTMRAMARLRERYKMEIVKPTNKQFDRPHVWQLDRFDHVRLFRKTDEDIGDRHGY